MLYVVICLYVWVWWYKHCLALYFQQQWDAVPRLCVQSLGALSRSLGRGILMSRFVTLARYFGIKPPACVFQLLLWLLLT